MMFKLETLPVLAGRAEAEDFLHRAGVALHEYTSELDARLMGTSRSAESIDELADRIAHIQSMMRAVRGRLAVLDSQLYHLLEIPR